MDYYLTQEELESIMTCTEQIQRIIGWAYGRQENILLRRSEIKVLDFAQQKKTSTGIAGGFSFSGC